MGFGIILKMGYLFVKICHLEVDVLNSMAPYRQYVENSEWPAEISVTEIFECKLSSSQNMENSEWLAEIAEIPGSLEF